MPRKKAEEVVPEIENTVEAAETAVIEAPAEKPKRGRRKKAAVATEEAAPAKKTTREPRTKKPPEEAAEAVVEKVMKAVTRRPRKKAVVPNFVIQNTADNEISYESVVEKVQTADVTSLNIYVKVEEGKAYYVVNGDAVGAVNLF